MAAAEAEPADVEVGGVDEDESVDSFAGSETGVDCGAGEGGNGSPDPASAESGSVPQEADTGTLRVDGAGNDADAPEQLTAGARTGAAFGAGGRSVAVDRPASLPPSRSRESSVVRRRGSTGGTPTSVGSTPRSGTSRCGDGGEAAAKWQAHVLMIVVGAYFGVAARLALNVLAVWLATVGDVHNSHAGGSLLLAMDAATARGGGFFLPNVAGTALMGVLTSLAASLVKNHPAAYVGATTGFCGSCTSFSTWQVFAASRFVRGDVVSGMMAVLVHVPVCVGALSFGEHVGTALEARLFAKQRAREDAERTQSTTARHESDVLVASLALDTYLSRKAHRGAPPLSPVGTTAMYSSARSRVGTEGDPEPLSLAGDVEGMEDDFDDQASAATGAEMDREDDMVEPVARRIERLRSLRHSATEAQQLYDQALAEQAETLVGQRALATTAEDEPPRSWRHRRWDSVMTALIASALVVTFLVLQPRGTPTAVWVAIAVAPVGANLRYALSFLNKRPALLCGRVVTDAAKWRFPLYTLIPNVTGTALSAAMAVVAASSGPDLDSPARVAADSVALGLCGSLSTVSTFIVETARFSNPQDAYRYVFVSVLTSQVVAIAILSAAGTDGRS